VAAKTQSPYNTTQWYAGSDSRRKLLSGEAQAPDRRQVHDHTFMDLLPQVRTEDLDQRDLENTRLIELHLETDIHIGAIDGWTPPQREAMVRNLVET